MRNAGKGSKRGEGGEVFCSFTRVSSPPSPSSPTLPPSPHSLLRLFTSFLLVLTTLPALACDVCQKKQPAPLRGITHGTGPQSAWDMPIIWGAAIIVAITLVLAVKMLVRPGERSSSHIKHRILHDGL